MNSSPALGIGIVGLGRVSPAHIEGYRALPNEARIVAVCDSNEALVRRVASDLGVAAYSDHMRMFGEPPIDAVVLLLPHRLHHPIALAALNAGKHVTVEKPLAVSTVECDELIAVAHERRLVLSVAENSRFVTSYLEVKRVIDEGCVGEVRLVRGFIYGSALPEFALASEAWKREPQGFAAILDAAPHFFYLFKWMFGPVRSVQAVERHWAQRHGLPECTVEDGALVTGTLASGGHFSIEVALNVEVPWGERLEIYGSRASLICDQLADPPVVMHRDAEDYGIAIPAVPATPRTWRDDSIRRGAADFVRAIRGGRGPSVSVHDAAYSVRLSEAAYRSIGAGGASVDVDVAPTPRSA